MADLRARPAGPEDYAQFLRSFAELAVEDPRCGKSEFRVARKSEL